MPTQSKFAVVNEHDMRGGIISHSPGSTKLSQYGMQLLVGKCKQA